MVSRRNKITDEERMAAVQEYLNGEGSYRSIAKKYGIDYERFRQLVIRAQAEGIESIKISHTSKKYPVRLNPDAHTIFHSDRGFQYTSKIFHQKLVEAGMIQSRSRVGRCIDYGPMEGWWGILKSEMYYLRKFTDIASLVAAIEEYIRYYNIGRYQIKLSSMTPMEYHDAYAA